jgi:diguanylate cyclase (GGDEF)-like protein/PAS domain S-box-containing protein
MLRTNGFRPGLRAWVLGGSALVVIGLSLTIAARASDQLRAAAADSAVGNAQAIVRGYVDTILTEEDLAIDAEPNPAVAEQLRRLVLSGDMRRINIWTRDGRVMYSTEESLRGARLGIDHELAQAFAGSPVDEFGERQATPAEAALPDRYLEIYAPIRGNSDGNPIGVFEVYVDADPIAARVEEMRGAVFLSSLTAGVILLVVLSLAFAGTSRRLGAQNRSLGRLNEQLGIMAGDLRHREARFRSLVQNSSDVVALVTDDGLVTYESDAAHGVLGHRPGGRVGRPFVDDVHPSDASLARAMLDGLAASPETHQTVELRLRHADGGWRWVEIVGQNRLMEPAVRALVLNYRDVTDRKRLEEQLQHDAFHDPLTGLANRALFGDRVTHALARRRPTSERAAVLFIDLDDFKLVNDSLGHAAGDVLLTAVAERIRACLRPQDTAARLGGDEFAVLVEETDAEQSAAIADRILAALRQPFAIGDRQVFMQASIGISVEGADGVTAGRETADDLLRNADAAMYTAKARGKARHQLYQPTMHAAALRRLELRERLESALDAGEFEVHYQPVVELAGETIVGAEALVRWREAGGEPAPPADFLAVAEESGLIVSLGRWVLEQSCHEAVRWGTGPAPSLSVAVNVASRQLADATFPSDVAAVLASSGLRPDRLIVEVTESALLDEGQVTNSAIAELKRLGVRVALDDFGTGYSSLSHLRRFPIDVLKIDRSFIAGIDGDNRDERALVRSIIRLAHSLRLETVAEGIERPEQLELLRRFGARLGQGFHFARAMDAAAFRRLIGSAARLAG